MSERRAKLGPNANETNDVRVPRVTGSQFRQETFFFSFCCDDAIKYTVDNGMGVNNDTVMTGVEQRVGINAV